ncbi:hypothetical protein O9993_08230 [Vibrio lentus]|nr:hypothetical protein [Vibrio lentus]
MHSPVASTYGCRPHETPGDEAAYGRKTYKGPPVTVYLRATLISDEQAETVAEMGTGVVAVTATEFMMDGVWPGGKHLTTTICRDD